MQGFTCTYLICLLIKYIDMLFMLFLCEAHYNIFYLCTFNMYQKNYNFVKLNTCSCMQGSGSIE